MRIKVWAIVALLGVVLVVVGAVLSFVPVASQGAQTVTESTPFTANETGYSLTGFVYASFSWTATSDIQFTLFTCPTLIANGQCSGTTYYVNQSGTSGSGSFSVQSGGFVAAYISGTGNPSASLTIKLAEPTFGLIAIIVGLVLLLVGVILRKRSKDRAAGLGWMDGPTFIAHISKPPAPKEGEPEKPPEPEPEQDQGPGTPTPET
jgi:uncharacterized membrane protein